MINMAGVYTVTQINAYIKNMFARDFALRDIRVSGEVSNCKYHTAGHIYFTLKDEGAAISCVMFASARQGLNFRLQDGQNIVLRGQVSVYEKAGSYQLYVKSCELAGRGVLYERFLKLKEKLQDMGMFDEIYKKPIPRFAMNIGVVTASTGAAIRDIINITSRRNPYAQLLLYPAYVQGEHAAESVAEGIRQLDTLGLDVIIIGRGGGSYEDLYAFNDEELAMTIFNAATPIISAVGHETDFTIADFVADLRAPTPSAAAELANFEYEVFEEQLQAYTSELEAILREKIYRSAEKAESYRLRLEKYSPEHVIRDSRSRLETIESRMRSDLEGFIAAARADNEKRESALKNIIDRRLMLTDRELKLRAGKLYALSPLKRISSGYGYVEGPDGHSVRSVSGIRPGDRLTTVIGDGKIISTVEKTESYEKRE